MKEIYKLKDNIIQNQAVVGKIFRFNGFKQEDFLPDDSFLYKFAKEIPDSIGFNFFSIGKKIKWFELETMFENFYFQTKKWLKQTYNFTDNNLKDFDIYYQKWLENMKGIIDNSLNEENYFASFLPLVKGFENNIRATARYQNNRINFIKQLNNINYKYFFGNNITSVRNIPVFPLQSSSSSIFKDKDFDFSEQEQEIFDKFIKDLYNQTVGIVIKERSKNINQNSKDLEKEIYIFFKSLIPKVYQLGEEVFYDGLDYIAFADSYFYPVSGYYSKIFDVSFLTNFISNEIVTKSQTEILKKVLRDAVKNNLIDYFVIKSSVVKDKIKLNLEFDKKKGRYIYKTSNKDYLVNINTLNEKRIIGNLGEHFNTRWRYGLTVGIYGKQKDNLFYIIKQLIDTYQKENIKVYFNLYEKENWFKYNNYLSIGLQEDLQISNFNGLYSYLFNDRVLQIKPYMYFGSDIKTNTPIFLNPFKDFKRGNRHIVLVGDSGLGKSILSQQMLTTLLKDKVIAIDPAGTFSNISKIFPLKSIDITKDLHNPIYIDLDATIYTRMQGKFDYKILYKEKIEMIINFLQIKYLDIDNQLRKYVNNILLGLYQKYNGALTISLLSDELEKLFVKIKQDKTNQIEYWKDIYDVISKERWLEKIGELLGAINNLEGSFIYDILDKKQDLLQQINKDLKIVFKIDGLNLGRIKGLSKSNKLIEGEDLIKLSTLEILVNSISQYFLLNKEYMDNILELGFEEKMKTYLFIDEVHNMLDIQTLRPILESFIREIRNRYASAFLLTQNITDFSKDMLKNIMIKMFLSPTDVESYLEKIKGISKENSQNNQEFEEEETKTTRILKLYYNDYVKQIENHKGIESLGFYHYGDQVFLSKNILSNFILKNIDILST